ncbi:MAG: MFS transporter [Candidatus Riflebacteria bacterium]|nr:MFS transporter [Candidatus Riflebacteria bacterium]
MNQFPSDKNSEDQTSFFSRMIPVRAEEWPAVFWCLMINLLLGICFTIGSSISQSLFLKEVGPDKLPGAMTVTALAIVAVFPFYSFLLTRIEVSRIFHFFAVIIGGGLLIIAGIMRLAAPSSWIYLFLLTWNAIAGMLYFAHFSNYLIHFFDTLQSKRVLPFIFSGIIIGTIVGGFSLTYALEILGIPFVIVGWSIMLIAVSLMVEANRVNKTFNRAPESDEGFWGSLKGNFDLVGKSPFIQTTLLAYLFGDLALAGSSVISQTIFAENPRFADAEALSAFLANLEAWIGVAGLALELVAIPFILRVGGVQAINFILPGATFLSLLLLILFPPFAFIIAIFIRFNLSAGSEYIEPSASNLLFNALPPEDKSKIRAFYSGFVEPLGPIATGLLLSLLMHFFALRSLIMIFVVFAGIYLFLTIRQNRLYAATLLELLETARLDLFARAAEGLQTTDPQIISALEKNLENDDVRIAALSARLLVDLRGPTSMPALEKALCFDKELLQAEILRLLSEIPPEPCGPVCNVSQFLSDTKGTLCEESIRYLIRRNAVNEYHLLIRNLMRSENVGIVAYAAMAGLTVSSLREESEKWLCEALSGSDVAKSGSAGAVFTAMAAINCFPVQFHTTILSLLSREDFLARAAARALLTSIKEISRIDRQHLGPALVEAGTRHSIPEVRLLFLKILAHRKDATSLRNYLPAFLGDISETVRNEAIRVARTMITLAETRGRRENTSGTRQWCSWLLLEAGAGKQNLLFSLANEALFQAARIEMCRAHLEENPEKLRVTPLVDTLWRDRTRLCIDTALRILRESERSGAAAIVGRGIASREPRMRANALEALQNIRNEDAKTTARLFEILLSDYSSGKLSAMILEAFPETKCDLKIQISELLSSENSWEAAIAKAAFAAS